MTREEPPERRYRRVPTIWGKVNAILVVDDVKEQRELAAKMLTKLDYRVTTVAGGEEAVAYLRKEQRPIW